MNNINERKLLNWELFSISEKVCNFLQSNPDQNLFFSISVGFIVKCNQTLNAINLLYDNKLYEPAQSLIRVLFELKLSFACFLKMSDNNTIETCTRVGDCMMLEKIKQARASDFAGIPDDLHKKLNDSEKLIEKRYSKVELKKMKKNGFSGLNIEQRADFTNNQEEYNIIYRNFSRNVHSTDYVENFINLNEDTKYDDYLNSRNLVGLLTTFSSAGYILDSANRIFKCGFESELNLLDSKHQDMKKG